MQESVKQLTQGQCSKLTCSEVVRVNWKSEETEDGLFMSPPSLMASLDLLDPGITRQVNDQVNCAVYAPLVIISESEAL